MRLVTNSDSTFSTTPANTNNEHSWPRQARAAALALDTAMMPRIERRSIPRNKYRVVGQLDVETTPGTFREPAEIYVREVNPWTVGFLTNQAFNTSDHAEIRLVAPDGTQVVSRCNVRRCREFIPGWFDCVIQLEKQQPLLALDQIREFAVAM